MDLYMGTTYLPGEPDVATDSTAWKAWFNSLTQAEKMAWASEYTGRPVTTHAAALGIARDYAIASGAEVAAHAPSAAFVAQHLAQRNQAMMRGVLLWGGVAAVAYFAFFRRARRG